MFSSIFAIHGLSFELHNFVTADDFEHFVEADSFGIFIDNLGFYESLEMSHKMAYLYAYEQNKATK